MQEYYDPYICHYGVLGMKWGVRKDPRTSAAKTRYKNAKKDYRKAARKQNIYPGFGVEGIKKAQRLESDANKKYLDRVQSEVNYKKAKADKINKERAEYKTYRRNMKRTGLPGSYADRQSGGKSTLLYNNISAKKGKTYADNIQKDLQKTYTKTLIGSGLVTAGILAADVYLNYYRPIK